MIQTKVLEQIKYLMFKNLCSENHRVYYIVCKKCTVRQATNDRILRHMSSACWIHKAPDAHSEHVILIDIHCNYGCMKAPQRYSIRNTAYLVKL
jgi:hypothetical protein